MFSYNISNNFRTFTINYRASNHAFFGSIEMKSRKISPAKFFMQLLTGVYYSFLYLLFYFPIISSKSWCNVYPPLFRS